MWITFAKKIYSYSTYIWEGFQKMEDCWLEEQKSVAPTLISAQESSYSSARPIERPGICIPPIASGWNPRQGMDYSSQKELYISLQNELVLGAKCF